MWVRVMAVAQSQGFHLERSASQPAGKALNPHLNCEAAAADWRSLTVISLKLKMTLLQNSQHYKSYNMKLVFSPHILITLGIK